MANWASSSEGCSYAGLVILCSRLLLAEGIEEAHD